MCVYLCGGMGVGVLCRRVLSLSLTTHPPVTTQHKNTQEEWPKPPTYVGGGMRMVRTEPPRDFDAAAEVGRREAWYCRMCIWVCAWVRGGIGTGTPHHLTSPLSLPSSPPPPLLPHPHPQKKIKTNKGEDARRCAWFAFEWSSALTALQADYARVQATCDPNALAVFLAHNPHHTEGLVTLALVLATHGEGGGV